MKKVLTVLLAVLMAGSMVACGGDDAATTTAAAGTTTAAATTTKAPSTTQAPDETEEPSKEFTLLPDDAEWAYKLFMCPYTPGPNGNEGGSFDPATDEMAQYIEANPEWYKNAATLSADWTKAQAPFGDRTSGFTEGQSPIGWAGETHGIMLYTTFELTADQFALISAASGQDVYMNLFYDNACYVYINGTLVFSNDANCGPNDWNEAQEPVDFNAEGLVYSELFKEGTNEIAVSLKDCWGGREFLMGLEYLPIS